MSILLKGFDMPKTCLNGGCPIGGEYCNLWWKAGGGSYGRHRDCPLVELPDNNVDAEPVRHGHWVDKSFYNDNQLVPRVRCSKCEFQWGARSKFCPNCGAKMDEQVTSKLPASEEEE